MSPEVTQEAIKGTFGLLNALDNPYVALFCFICIFVVLVSLGGMGVAFYYARKDKVTADARYDGLVKETKEEFKEMHRDSISADRDMDKTLQSLGNNLQTITSIVTALATRGNNGA